MRLRKWEKEIETAIQRLFVAEKAIKQWISKGGGDMTVFNALNLKGNREIGLKPHPFEEAYVYDYKKEFKKPLSEEEKQAWTKIFGKPLIVPKDLNLGTTIKELLDQIKQRRRLYQETVAFTKQSRFRHYHRGK